MNWETLLCLGDSLTFGARSYLGYPEICADLLSKKLNKHWNVINHATNGYTTIDLLRSLDKSWSSLKAHQPSLITIMIGTNDVKNNTADHNFSSVFSLLITKVKLLATNNNILVFKIPPLMPGVFYPYNFSMNDKINNLNKVIESHSNQHQIRTLELMLQADDFYDGVHFGEVGSHNAANQLSNFILKDKGY